jgi:hypothetical protein
MDGPRKEERYVLSTDRADEKGSRKQIAPGPTKKEAGSKSRRGRSSELDREARRWAPFVGAAPDRAGQEGVPVGAVPRGGLDLCGSSRLRKII